MLQVKKWTAGQGKWTIVSMFLAVANFAAAPTGSSLITRFLKQPQTHSRKQSPLTQSGPLAQSQPQTQHQAQTQKWSQTQPQFRAEPQLQLEPAAGFQSLAQKQDVSEFHTTNEDVTELSLASEAVEAKTGVAPEHATGSAVPAATDLHDAQLSSDSADAQGQLGRQLDEVSKVNESQPDKQKPVVNGCRTSELGHTAQLSDTEMEGEATAFHLLERKSERMTSPADSVSDAQRSATLHTYADSPEHTAAAQDADSAHAVLLYNGSNSRTATAAASAAPSRAAEHQQGMHSPRVDQQGLVQNRPDPAQHSNISAAQHSSALSFPNAATGASVLSHFQTCAQQPAADSAQHDVVSKHPEAKMSRDSTAQAEPELNPPDSLHQAGTVAASDKPLKRPRKATDTREPDHRKQVRR